MKYDQIIEHYGTCKAAAQAIDTHIATVNRWRLTYVPLWAQVMWEVDSNGALKADLPEYFRRQALAA